MNSPLNFINVIKNMQERERKKVRAETLIELILQVPEHKNVSEEKILELVASFETQKNTAENV